MGVDINFFVETRHPGEGWELQAEFHLPRMAPLFAEMSHAGVRGFPPGTTASVGLPEDVSRTVLFKWGDTTKEKADFPSYFDESFCKIFELKPKVKVYRRFGFFGEAHMWVGDFYDTFENFRKKYEADGWELPLEYEAVREYMVFMAQRGKDVRAVYWFDT